MTPTTIETDRTSRRDDLRALLEQHPFRPAWWLRNQHLQTVWGPFFRKQSPVAYERETWPTPDGDALSLYLHRGDSHKPWVLLLHGLEGTINSFYITAFNHAFHRLGWNVATLIFRSCDGAINQADRIYHMGETTDLDWVVSQLPARHDVSRLHLVGVSLGANVLCKWLGEQGEGVPSIVASAAAISPPFRPDIAIDTLEKALYGLYVKKFLKTLVPKALEKERQFPGCIEVDRVRRCTSFRDFDTDVTARLHGFEDAMDYWKRVGCAQFLAAIRVPTLLITSEDDPFNPPETIPRDIAAASPYLYPQWTQRGGHVGFVAGRWPWKTAYWLEQQLVRFAQAIEGRGASGAGS